LKSYGVRKSSGSLAIFAAIRRASPCNDTIRLCIYTKA
jgi:hypothetical protein